MLVPGGNDLWRTLALPLPPDCGCAPLARFVPGGRRSALPLGGGWGCLQSGGSEVWRPLVAPVGVTSVVLLAICLWLVPKFTEQFLTSRANTMPPWGQGVLSALFVL